MTCRLPGAGGVTNRPADPALVVGDEVWSHGSLATAAERLLDRLRRSAVDLDPGATEPKFALLCDPGPEFVAALWATWLAGAVAVPLCGVHPPEEWRYVLQDASVSALWVSSSRRRAIEPVAEELGLPLLDSSMSAPGSDSPAPDSPAPDRLQVEAGRGATVVYTSGTTGRPKGALVDHRALLNRIEVLAQAWRIHRQDRVLHLLPLHHVHGLENALLCPLQCGASVEILRGFDPESVWERLASGDVTVFMGVPTHYAKLIRHHEAADAERQARWSEGARRMRLMVSGSAALPVETLDRWESITGHRLLERYGMTEIGMALSNPYDGERRPGTVGQPLPGIEIRRVSKDGTDEPDPACMAELWVRSPSMFREYLGMAEATESAFRDGWFRTGDMAVDQEGAVRLMGRANRDVINVGGNLVSALEIEDCFAAHPGLVECAVVGVSDDTWGQRVGLVAVPAVEGASPDLDELRTWAADRLAREKLPTRIRTVVALPRNAMGKVRKGELDRLFC